LPKIAAELWLSPSPIKARTQVIDPSSGVPLGTTPSSEDKNRHPVDPAAGSCMRSFRVDVGGLEPLASSLSDHLYGCHPALRWGTWRNIFPKARAPCVPEPSAHPLGEAGFSPLEKRTAPAVRGQAEVLLIGGQACLDCVVRAAEPLHRARPGSNPDRGDARAVAADDLERSGVAVFQPGLQGCAGAAGSP
jgi:hypothetical protein